MITLGTVTSICLIVYCVFGVAYFGRSLGIW